MYLERELIGTIIILIQLLFSESGKWYQVLLNHSNQSVIAISAYEIILRSHGALLNLFYIYLLDLPIICKFAIIVSVSSTITMLFQKWYYSKHSFTKKITKYAFINLPILFMVFIIAGNYAPFYIGHICGWLFISISLFRGTPQIIHNWQRGSVRGLSLFFILGHLFVAATNIATTVLLSLPLQNYVQMVYMFTIWAIILSQYYYYSK